MNDALIGGFPKITAQNSPLYRVVAIQSFWRKGSMKGKVNMSSGILMSHQLLLTAAHNIFIPQYKEIASEVRIFFTDGDIKINEKSMSLFFKLEHHRNVYMEFKDKTSYLYDMALIRMKRLQKFESPLPIFIRQKLEKQGQSQVAYICGFPDFKAKQNRNAQVISDQNSSKSLSELRVQTGVLEKISDNYIYYKQAETVIGESGGPIFINKNGTFYLIGIHTELNEKIRTGRGIVLNQFIWNLLVQWASQLKANLRQGCSQNKYNTPILRLIVKRMNSKQPEIKEQHSNRQQKDCQEDKSKGKTINSIAQSFQTASQHVRHALQKMNEIVRELKIEITKMEQLVRQGFDDYNSIKQLKGDLINYQFGPVVGIINKFSQKSAICQQKLKWVPSNEFTQIGFSSFENKSAQQAINEEQNQQLLGSHDQNLKHQQLDKPVERVLSEEEFYACFLQEQQKKYEQQYSKCLPQPFC